MRFMISGGGTGGGVYPALAIVQAIKALYPDSEFMWVASDSGPERAMVEAAGLPFEGVASGPVVGVGLRAVSSAVKIAWGVLQAGGIMRRWKPDALLATGGWTTIPPVLAAGRRVPLMLYVPDVEPGAALSFMARRARKIAVTVSRSTEFFPAGKVIVTGYPLRESILNTAGYNTVGTPLDIPPDSRGEARRRFGLEDRTPILLVFGGSKGARSINQALAGHLPDLLAHVQVIHLSGRLDHDEAHDRAQGLPPELASRYHLYDYLESPEMALALAAADLVVSRAGASVMGEFPLFGIPAILVPYPYAWRYQKTNANVLEENGGAIHLEDERLGDELLNVVRNLIDNPVKRARMAEAMRALARPDAAASIAEQLAAMATVK